MICRRDASSPGLMPPDDFWRSMINALISRSLPSFHARAVAGHSRKRFHDFADKALAASEDSFDDYAHFSAFSCLMYCFTRRFSKWPGYRRLLALRRELPDAARTQCFTLLAAKRPHEQSFRLSRKSTRRYRLYIIIYQQHYFMRDVTAFFNIFSMA